jgi:hypothetical protein
MSNYNIIKVLVPVIAAESQESGVLCCAGPALVLIRARYVVCTRFSK